MSMGGCYISPENVHAVTQCNAVIWFLPPFDQRFKSLYLFHLVAHRVSV